MSKSLLGKLLVPCLHCLRDYKLQEGKRHNFIIPCCIFHSQNNTELTLGTASHYGHMSLSFQSKALVTWPICGCALCHLCKCPHVQLGEILVTVLTFGHFKVKMWTPWQWEGASTPQQLWDVQTEFARLLGQRVEEKWEMWNKSPREMERRLLSLTVCIGKGRAVGSNKAS